MLPSIYAQPTFDFSKTYLEASGGSQTISASTFSRIALGTLASDAGSNWDASNNWYVCPATGIYVVSGFVRYDDGSPRGVNYGVGVDVMERDSPSFAWYLTPAGNQPGYRYTSVYGKQTRQQAGDRLRLVTYADGNALYLNAASLTIRQVG